MLMQLLVWWDINEENQICPISSFTGWTQNWICCLSAEVMIYLLSQRDLELSTLPQKLNMGSYTWNQTKKIWCTSTRFCKEGISIHEALKGHICSGWHLLVKLCNPPKLRKEVIYIREALKGHVCWGWHLLVKLCTPTKRASLDLWASQRPCLLVMTNLVWKSKNTIFFRHFQLQV